MVSELWMLVGAPVARSVAGWLENAMADGKVTLLECKRLLGTVLRLGIPALALFYGLELDAAFAASIPLLVEYAFKAIKK